MPTFTNALPSFVKRNPGTTLLGSIALATGVVFTIFSSGGSPLLQCFSGTGCVLNQRLTVQGVVINTGSELSIGDANNRYLLKQGSTATGGILIENSTLHGALPSADAGILLETAGTESGRIIHAQDQLQASGSLAITGTTKTSSGIIANRTLDIGWSVVASANQACNTTCTYACVLGEDTSVLGSFVDCRDATADRCVCAGPN